MTSRRQGPKKTKKTGIVTAFIEKRGVGYIASDEPDDDGLYVVDQNDIDLPGYAVLESGQFVEFEVAAGSSGGDEEGEPAAENVRPIASA